jgi:CRISPR-associated protein Csm3
MAQGVVRLAPKALVGKVKLAGILRTVTGLHIGASKEVLEIGALDLPIIKDAVTQEPYIPGSSLKGKLRSLCERQMPEVRTTNDFFNRNVGRAQYRINIHVCDTADAAARCQVCRLFGASGGREDPGSNFPARLKARDAYFTNYTRDTLGRVETGLLYTEIKYENALDRITAAANPRQIERVPAGSDFTFEIIYDVEQPADLAPDLETLFQVLKLLEEDTLGGHGSRGSGKVLFAVTTLVARKTDAYRRAAPHLVIQPFGLPVPQRAEEVVQLPTLDRAQAAISELIHLFTTSGA